MRSAVLATCVVQSGLSVSGWQAPGGANRAGRARSAGRAQSAGRQSFSARQTQAPSLAQSQAVSRRVNVDAAAGRRTGGVHARLTCTGRWCSLACRGCNRRQRGTCWRCLGGQSEPSSWSAKRCRYRLGSIGLQEGGVSSRLKASSSASSLKLVTAAAGTEALHLRARCARQMGPRADIKSADWPLWSRRHCSAGHDQQREASPQQGRTWRTWGGPPGRAGGTAAATRRPGSTR